MHNMHHYFCVCYHNYAGAIAWGSARFGSGIGPILFTSVACVGNEHTLFQCGYDVLTTSCSHSNDAGVACEPGKKFSVK